MAGSRLVDDDEAGLESVSEPEVDDLADYMGGTAIADDDPDEADTTVEAVTISPVRSRRTEGADGEEEGETKAERNLTSSSQPVFVERPSSDLIRDRPALNTRFRTESWVETGADGDEAPNGARAR